MCKQRPIRKVLGMVDSSRERVTRLRLVIVLCCAKVVSIKFRHKSSRLDEICWLRSATHHLRNIFVFACARGRFVSI